MRILFKYIYYPALYTDSIRISILRLSTDGHKEMIRKRFGASFRAELSLVLNLSSPLHFFCKEFLNCCFLFYFCQAEDVGFGLEISSVWRLLLHLHLYSHQNPGFIQWNGEKTHRNTSMNRAQQQKNTLQRHKTH